MELLEMFLEEGCPHNTTKRKRPPRHPVNEGSVERSNQDIEVMLHAWLNDNDTKNWAIGYYLVQFQKNSSFHRTIKRSHYKALFGTEPKTGL
ncbi:integrase catalytic domain-containing protein [Nephila pilipes]|uniref:Integrase catalytic domain-containing protein n=1 Tax=Nephila pilipes TaxID=299642 RepID=A0A8X6QKF9_NEPPI|nr:integrase catalytic domain-containing protein [Nephila pilipes]